MSWTLVTTASFDRRARKFLTRHPDLRPRLAETLEKLRADPFDPSLRLHPLTGKLQGMQAVSLTYSYRITLTLARVPFRLEPPDPAGIKVAFVDAGREALGDGSKYRGPVGVVDFAQDGRNNVLVAEGSAGFRLLVNSNGVFHPRGNLWPGAPASTFHRCLVGDLNNDGVPDALMLGDKGVKLFKFTTNGTVTDATLFAGFGKLSAVEGALVDLDFRGNLDLISVNPGGQGVRVLRNLGNMYFTDTTGPGSEDLAVSGGTHEMSAAIVVPQPQAVVVTEQEIGIAVVVQIGASQGSRPLTPKAAQQRRLDVRTAGAGAQHAQALERVQAQQILGAVAVDIHRHHSTCRTDAAQAGRSVGGGEATVPVVAPQPESAIRLRANSTSRSQSRSASTGASACTAAGAPPSAVQRGRVPPCTSQARIGP